MAPASSAPAAPTAPARINGGGSSYVALAMQQWIAAGQGQGLDVNYTGTGSPTGLAQYNLGQLDFAGTEAEFASLGLGSDQAVTRGFQYVPDVGGAVAIMYNVSDRSGNKVDYLHLSRRTVAKIFMGFISRWSDPAITADNKGLVLPNEPIEVVYRSSPSGTTALFYDFVAHTEPQLFQQWTAQHNIPTNYRVIELPPTFAPKVQGRSTSDDMARYVASPQGKWAITYDEFGYADLYGAEAAWVQNQSGQWVLPFPRNISAALASARLRPDLSQELSGVYASSDPEAYPISAYSYVVTQCARAPDRATCKGNYSTGGISETLEIWLRYIACQGQANLPVGYSPLPKELSQEMANSIGRMKGMAPERLTADNCNNPRFRGQIPSPPLPEDPLAGLPPYDPNAPNDPSGDGGSDTTDRGGGAGPGATTSTTTNCPESSGTTTTMADNSSSSSSTASTTTTTTSPDCDQGGAAGRGDVEAVGGGSGDWRDDDPVSYSDKLSKKLGRWPLLVMLGMLAMPPMGGTFWGYWRKARDRRKGRKGGTDRSVDLAQLEGVHVVDEPPDGITPL